ncbi:hypothetical protein BH10PSE16_BH10PSE16_20060 [soil metagenome]
MNFSIIIPLYNKAPYIIDTIKSVLAQTFTDFEIIVVDDGSSDGGAELVAALVDPRLRLVRQANAGVSVARNHGIAQANGEWVVFLDADDWHHPRFLASLVTAQQTHPEVEAVATQYISVPDDCDSWQPKWPILKDPPEIELITDLPARWLKGITMCTGSIAVRTVRLQQMQPCFPPGESQGEDLDLWFRLAEQTPIALVNARLLAYRVDVAGSLTKQHVIIPPSPSASLPFHKRLRMRALSGAMSQEQRQSALWFIAQESVSIARYAVASGMRMQGGLWLLRGSRAATGKRWWLTAVMILLWPSKLIRNWEIWRLRQTPYSINTSNTAQ